MTAIMSRDMSWQERGACRGMNRDIFFPEFAWQADPVALLTCHACDVREDCLTWALETNQEYGIWGGLTEEQRENIVKTKSRVRCPDCRGSNVVEDGHNEICISCGLSWSI